jgi:hypothetical protein
MGAVAGELRRKRDGGRADAILIARSGLKFLRPGQLVAALAGDDAVTRQETHFSS